MLYLMSLILTLIYAPCGIQCVEGMFVCCCSLCCVLSQVSGDQLCRDGASRARHVQAVCALVFVFVFCFPLFFWGARFGAREREREREDMSVYHSEK